LIIDYLFSPPLHDIISCSMLDAIIFLRRRFFIVA